MSHSGSRFRAFLKQLIDSGRATRSDIAQVAGVTPNAVSNWLGGWCRPSKEAIASVRTYWEECPGIRRARHRRVGVRRMSPASQPKMKLTRVREFAKLSAEDQAILLDLAKDLKAA